MWSAVVSGRPSAVAAAEQSATVLIEPAPLASQPAPDVKVVEQLAGLSYWPGEQFQGKYCGLYGGGFGGGGDGDGGGGGGGKRGEGLNVASHFPRFQEVYTLAITPLPKGAMGLWSAPKFHAPNEPPKPTGEPSYVGGAFQQSWACNHYFDEEGYFDEDSFVDEVITNSDEESS